MWYAYYILCPIAFLFMSVAGEKKTKAILY
jgi:hypothetical protein